MSRSISPYRLNMKVSPVKHVRLSRNTALPAIQRPHNNSPVKTTEEPYPLTSRPITREKTRDTGIMRLRASVGSDAQSEAESLRSHLIQIKQSKRVQLEKELDKKVDESHMYTDKTVTDYSFSQIDHKPKIISYRAESNLRTRDTTALSEIELNQKVRANLRYSTQAKLALGKLHDEKDKESETLNWSSEDEIASSPTPYHVLDSKRKSCPTHKDTRTKSTEKSYTEQQIYQEPSVDRRRCAKCKKCNECIDCEKCTNNIKCARCLSCQDCTKCTDCSDREDLSPQKESHMKLEFFNRFKTLEELERKNLLKPNPRDFYLKACRDKQVLPFPLDTYNSNAQAEKSVQLRFYRLGNERVSALAKSISVNEDLEKVDLTANALEGEGIAEILNKLSESVKMIDLSENKLDGIGLRAICSLLRNRKFSNLRVLKLEKMDIGDRQGEILAAALIENCYIKILNLARNQLGDRTMARLANFIEESTTLQQLYLHWNNILWKGACYLCAGINKSVTLKVLDLSWNRIGHRTHTVSVEKFCDMFQKNTSLVHLDISYCGFREEECTMISQGLLQNHTILGVHMAGNKWMADDLGFVNKIQDMETVILKDALWHRLPLNKDKVSKHAIKSKATGNCWICEGWREVKFVWKDTKNLYSEPDPVYVHLSFDNWRGDLMQKGEDNTYTFYKMCPPGTLKFYFSIKGEKTDLGEYVHFSEDLPESSRVHTNKQTKIPNSQNLYVPSVGLMSVDYFDALVSETLDVAIERCLPRPEPPKPPVIIDTTWRFKKSIFRRYRRDDENLERRCFLYDVACGKLPRVVRDPDELEKVKEAVWRIYKHLRAAYKFYSAQSPIGEIYSMPLNPYTDFVNKAGALDKNLQLNAIDKNFIACKSMGKKKQLRNPEKALVRYQFIEVLVRCAVDKYLTCKKTCSYVEAVEWFMKDIEDHCKEFDHNEFRYKRLWNPFCDYIYQANISIMRPLFDKYCDHTRTLKSRNNQNLGDFYKFVRDAGLINVHISERDPTMIFSLAMMTQVDELDSGRHLRMQFVEFLDAFARLADRLTLPDESYTYYQLHDKIGELMKICVTKCLKLKQYQVLMPPDTLKAIEIDLS